MSNEVSPQARKCAEEILPLDKKHLQFEEWEDEAAAIIQKYLDAQEQETLEEAARHIEQREVTTDNRSLQAAIRAMLAEFAREVRSLAEGQPLLPAPPTGGERK